MTSLLMCTITPINSSLVRSHTNFLRSILKQVFILSLLRFALIENEQKQKNTKQNKKTKKYMWEKVCLLYRIRTLNSDLHANFTGRRRLFGSMSASTNKIKCAVKMWANFFDARTYVIWTVYSGSLFLSTQPF